MLEPNDCLCCERYNERLIKTWKTPINTVTSKAIKFGGGMVMLVTGFGDDLLPMLGHNISRTLLWVGILVGDQTSVILADQVIRPTLEHPLFV